LLKLPEASDLALGFALRRRGGKTLGNGLALQFVGEPQVGTMAGIARLMTVAIGIAATAAGGRDRTRTKIAQGGNLRQHLGTTLL